MERIEDEQEKMRLFKEDVKSKFGDLMDGDGLLEEDDDDDYNQNNGIYNNGLGGFKLDGDDSQIIYDEAEPEWNRNRQPKSKYPKINNGGINPYNAPDMSQTHNNSLPSRSMRGPPTGYGDTTYDRTQQVIVNDDPTQNSMLGVNKNSYDASLQSDLIGRRTMDNANSLNNQLGHSQDGQKHSLV